ncbi:hypothetical protein Csa_008701 [Cucumis sativus]|uniref:Uncharacterized protein n=1 Tax=Cucumis sativus TaxID=3659 RepID=A0A0A0KUV4_CUCSA|nr:hypothetical protein Csa_008701 [Cucumis sativus]
MYVWRGDAGSDQDQPRTCPVKFASTGTCQEPYGTAGCYDEVMGKYGNFPPKDCQCIPNGDNSRFCQCNIYC